MTPSGATGSCPTWCRSVPPAVHRTARAVLMVGARNNPYWIGSYDPAARRFHPGRSEPRFVHLGLYYCINPHLVDDRGPHGAPRRLLHGWVLGARSPVSPVDTMPYWIGAQASRGYWSWRTTSCCRALYRRSKPCADRSTGQRDLAILPGTAGYLEQVSGDALELESTVDLRRTGARRFGAGVRLSRDGRGARIWYEPAGKRIGVDRLLGPEQVYANPAANRQGDLQGAAEKLQAQQVAAPAGSVHGESGTVTLRIFVDRSILEVYCGGAALTDRLYPLPPPPASTYTQRAERPTSRRFPCGRCAASGDRDDSAPRQSGRLIAGQRDAVQHAPEAVIVVDWQVLVQRLSQIAQPAVGHDAGPLQS